MPGAQATKQDRAGAHGDETSADAPSSMATLESNSGMRMDGSTTAIFDKNGFLFG